MRLLLAILALLGASFWLATSPRLQPAGREPIPGGEPDLRHGRNVFFAGGCPSCHRSPGRESPFELGGGRAIEAPMGTFHPPNISPDPQYGIGAWVPQQFLRALRAGVSPDGSHYYPIFPYTSFERIADADARDLFAFLRTLPPMTGDAPRHRLVFPFQLRRAVGLWKLLFLDGDPFTPDPGRDERWNRGAYLVEALLHCAECHSPRNLLEAIPPDRRFTGGPDPERRVAWIPDLTESETGLRGWSRDELVELLSAGFFTPGYSPRGERMAEVIEDASHLPREDVEAVAEYVLTLAARPSADRGGGVEPPPAVGAPVAIRARLHRTWWEVEYDAAEPDRSFTTANEAHVPAARPVVLELASDEPIDSFCAPGLIDGREPVGAEGTEFRLVAARPGLFRARADCGRDAPIFLIVAQPAERFEVWRAQQVADAAPPHEAERARGREIFLRSSCVLCHTVRGTRAGGRSAPDLTHFARRHYLAAGALPRSSATVAAWISDPEKIKPGTSMPPTRLAADELKALVGYVNGLR